MIVILFRIIPLITELSKTPVQVPLVVVLLVLFYKDTSLTVTNQQLCPTRPVFKRRYPYEYTHSES